MPAHAFIGRWAAAAAAIASLLAPSAAPAAGACANISDTPAVSLTAAELDSSLHFADPMPSWLTRYPQTAQAAGADAAGFAANPDTNYGLAASPCDHAYERTAPLLNGALVFRGQLASNGVDPRLQNFDDGGALRTSLTLTPKPLPLDALHLGDSWFDAGSLFDVSVANASLSKRFQLGGRAALRGGMLRMLGAADSYGNVSDYGFLLAAGGSHKAFDRDDQKPGVFDRFLGWLQDMRRRLGSVFADTPSHGLSASAEHSGAAFWLTGLQHAVAQTPGQPTDDGSLVEFAGGSNLRLTPRISTGIWTSLTRGAATLPDVAEQSQGALYQAGLTVDYEQGALLLRGRSSYARADLGPSAAPDFRLTRVAGDFTAGWSVDLAPLRLQLLSGIRYGEYRETGLGVHSLWAGENGSGDRSLHRLDTSLGIAASGQLHAWGRVLTPTLSFGWQHSLSDSAVPLWIQFDADRVFDYRIARARTVSDSAHVRTELRYAPNKNTALFARFSAVVGGPMDTQVAAAGVKLHW